MTTSFADRVGTINITGGLARIDFLSLQNLNVEKNEASFELSHRLVMPLDGLMQLAENLNRLREELAKQGATPAQPPTSVEATKSGVKGKKP
jgi:hypothetical protein